MRKGRKFSEYEIDFLKRNYQNMLYEEMSEILNRSSKSISDKIRSLGFRKYNRRIWSTAEIEFVKRNYVKMSYLEMAKVLKRSKNKVSAKVNELCLVKPRRTSWTDEQIEFLKDNYYVMTYKELSIHINKSTSTTENMAARLWLSKRKQINWTKEEENELIELSNKHSQEDIAKILKRSLNSIRNKMFMMDINKLRCSNTFRRVKRRWTKEEVLYLIKYSKNLTIKELSIRLRRTERSIDIKVRKLKLPIKKKIKTSEKFNNLAQQVLDGTVF